MDCGNKIYYFFLIYIKSGKAGTKLAPRPRFEIPAPESGTAYYYALVKRTQ